MILLLCVLGSSVVNVIFLGVIVVFRCVCVKFSSLCWSVLLFLILGLSVMKVLMILFIIGLGLLMILVLCMVGCFISVDLILKGLMKWLDDLIMLLVWLMN